MSTDHPTVVPHRKRKRRREDKSAIDARLVLDDHVKGDVGILSEDLFAELFPTATQGSIDTHFKPARPDYSCS